MATLGPASDSDAAIGALTAAGVDLFRLNFSHGTHERHAAAVTRIRAAAQQQGQMRRRAAGPGGSEDSYGRARRRRAD